MLSLLQSPLGFASTPGGMGMNPCEDMKYNSTSAPSSAMSNVACFGDVTDVTDVTVATAGPQAGADVTTGQYTDQAGVADDTGLLATDSTPITTTLADGGLCAVNVHWHIGAEHRSVGQYDEAGQGPTVQGGGRRLSGGGDAPREGHRCNNKYDDTDSKFEDTVRHTLISCPDWSSGRVIAALRLLGAAL